MSNYVLAIGIDKYTACSPLNNAVRDINNIIDVLSTKYDFEKNDIITLINEQATLENIINELEILISKQSVGDNLLILFSGHGDYDDILEMGYLIPHEAVPFSKSTYLPYSTLFSYIKALKSHHILLISDSCYSGSIFNPTRSIETSKEKLDKIPSKWAITSGRVEPVSDGIPGQNSPFAEALLKVLRENEDNLVSISELSNKIVAEVAGKSEQIPRGEPLQSYGHKGGEFIFRKKALKDKQSGGNEIFDSNKITKEEIITLIKSHYTLEKNIEEAENENKTGTIRRLNREKESLTNILNKELLKELEIRRNVLLKGASDILSKEYMIKYQKTMEIRDMKNECVKKQDYERAAKTRDMEKELEEELNTIIDSSGLRKTITFSSVDSLYNDYFLVQIILDARSNTKFEKRQLIEALFIKLLFLDLSFMGGYISQYIYKDSRDNLVTALKDRF